MSESDFKQIFGFDVPSDSYYVGFRGIDHGTMIDIPPDRRVSNMKGDLDERAKNLIKWTQNEYKTHVQDKLPNMEYDIYHTHSFGGDCEARWRRAGGYLYFIAWRDIEGDQIDYTEPQSLYKYWEMHPRFEIIERGYRCSFCNQIVPPENMAHSVAESSDELGYVCQGCHYFLKLKENVEEYITNVRQRN
jgi:hypothetical protein